MTQIRVLVPMSAEGSEVFEYLEGQCHATTRLGRRCANPIFYGQWYSGSDVVSRDDGGYVIDAGPEEHHRWTTGLCDLHYDRLQAGKTVEIAEILRARLTRLA